MRTEPQLFQLGAVEGGLEGGLLVFAFGDGLDEGEHFVGGLGADDGGNGFLGYGEADGEVAESSEDFGSGLGGAVGVLFF